MARRLKGGRASIFESDGRFQFWPCWPPFPRFRVHFASERRRFRLWLCSVPFGVRCGGAGGGTRTPTGNARRIFIPLRLSPPLANASVRGLDYPFTMPPKGVRCCPSSLYTFPCPGLARDCQLKGFPEFGQFYVAGFPARTQWPKSVASTCSATPAKPSRPIEVGGFAAKDDVNIVRRG